jgi:hypothetical protein
MAGFTKGVTLKPGASEHLCSLLKIKEDEDATIAEQKRQKTKVSKSSKKTCTKKINVK